jgi:hypothetical protein
MALAQRQPTKDEIETPAGVIKLEVPLREIITKPSGESIHYYSKTARLFRRDTDWAYRH